MVYVNENIAQKNQSKGPVYRALVINLVKLLVNENSLQFLSTLFEKLFSFLFRLYRLSTGGVIVRKVI